MKESVSIGDGNFSFYGYPLEQLVSDSEFHEIYNVSPECSGAWRGYQGRWLILVDVLYLRYLIKDPCGFGSSEVEAFDLKKLFPEYNEFKDALKADWFSGEIVIPISESKYVEGRKTSTGHTYSEHEVLVYVIENGNVKDRKIETRER